MPEVRIRVNSEIGKLRAVIMRPPGKGIERCTPINIGSFAWDAVPSPERRRRNTASGWRRYARSGPRS
jgi:Arginine deiminase